MSPNQETFAYGGDEVDLSVWDMEQAFSPRPQTTESENKKRKRDALFPGEVWRGKNVSNTIILDRPV
jgi:ribosome biogenesis protein NSA1